ncbi:tail protein X [Chelatococcus asaccharovorans]|uniref:Phage tail protein X n=1 Tax=Chelatococcus asaccharovorans TaxID=28210 RepID=A0A2V3UB64_9HYPH|nr:tail protein X [Chelatococcus asaccharovorans]MBS7703334.1 tail protein X [Chelatococcus asaccharovorans]PXW61669.1 phage tail protein X [Chelatococcus asaccharovorans]
MAEIYVTKPGDMVDLICHRRFGHTRDRVVEKTLELNRGLAGLNHPLPAGVTIALPEIKPSPVRRVRLYD